MTLKDITYKEILDAEGNFSALEIWQGDQHVTVTLRSNQFNSSGPSDRSNWHTVKSTVDRIATRVHADSEK